MAPGIEVPRIAAIVCTYRRHDLLGGCLAALGAQTVPRGVREIVVVDNSADPAATRAFPWPDEVVLVATERPGLSHARNLGIQASRADIVAFIDDDARAAPDWLETILRAFDASPDAAAAGGRVIPAWPAPRPSWLDASHDGFLSVVEHGPAARPLDPHEWLAGTNLAFRRACLPDGMPFAETLGRSPGTLLGNEEIALLARLRAAGFEVRYDPRIVVEHHIAAERLTQDWMRRRVAWQALSDLMLDEVLHPLLPPHPRSDPYPSPPVPALRRAAPDAAAADALWARVAAYLRTQPPALRGAAGLLRPLDDAAAFRGQTEAIAALLRLLAGHGGAPCIGAAAGLAPLPPAPGSHA